MLSRGNRRSPVSDLTNYQAAFKPYGKPFPERFLRTGHAGSRGQQRRDREESDLDLELSGAVARGASIIFVYSENVMDAVNYAIDQNLAPVISVSYGSCEPDNGLQSTLTYQTWAQQANAQGITWFDASGDDGAADCSGDSFVTPAAQAALAVDTPASVPEVTGVGGTQFVEGNGTYWSGANDAHGGSALGYVPETGWNTSVADGSPSASGGGVSIFFSQPLWQVGPGVPRNNARNVPDISGSASPDHDGYIVYTDGQKLGTGLRRNFVSDAGNGWHGGCFESVPGVRRPR